MLVRPPHSKSTHTVAGSMALGVASLLLSGCFGDGWEEPLAFRSTPYTLPPEITNPLERPANQISVVHAQCGPDFHFMHLGAPSTAPGQTFSVGGQRCTVAANKSVWFNGGSYACYRCNLSANDIFHNLMDLDGATDVRIHAITKPGCHKRPEGSVASSPTTVFTDIFATIGINTNGCATDPLSLGQAGQNPNAPGWIAEHDNTNVPTTDDSQVIKANGSRATFGFFITFQRGGQTVEYFVLFSYDRLGSLCATEMFMWGPITRDANGDLTATPPLILGAAINAAGNLIDEVPIDLATASTMYPDASDPPGGRPVKVGTHLPNQGCLECHGGNGADATFPFPWDTSVEELNDGCDDDDETDDGGTESDSEDSGGTGSYESGDTGSFGTEGSDVGGGTGGEGGTSHGGTSYGGTGDGDTGGGGTSYGGTSYGGTGGTGYGETGNGGTSYGGTSYGGTSYGGTSYGGGTGGEGGEYGEAGEGGTSYGGTSYGGTSYGGTSYGGTSYGGTTYGTTYGVTSYGGTGGAGAETDGTDDGTSDTDGTSGSGGTGPIHVEDEIDWTTTWW